MLTLSRTPSTRVMIAAAIIASVMTVWPAFGRHHAIHLADQACFGIVGSKADPVLCLPTPR